MRAKLSEDAESGRVREGPWGSDRSYGLNGMFLFVGPTCANLAVIVSDGREPRAQGWEHVSVSCPGRTRTPNWSEMCYIKNLFWEPDETVIQFHPAKSEYVNCHQGTLHLWRNSVSPVSLPPSILVGPR